MAADNCLDMGGSFNYETQTCDFEKNHPYVPFNTRHPNIFRIAGTVFIVGIVLFAETWLFPKKYKMQNNRFHLTRRKRRDGDP